MRASLIIVAYNQERFVATAVAHALAQDYTPLEIIISDDYSTDGTWEAIRRAVSTYAGPHEVRIRRTRENVGLLSHLNEVWAECRGDWIVVAAGDDYSEPDRVSDIMRAAAVHRGTSLIQSWVREVDEDGREIGITTHGSPADGPTRYTLEDRIRGRTYAPHGAAMAYAATVVHRFGPLPTRFAYEDNIVNVRAELVGDALVLPDVLVNHRQHEGQITRRKSDTVAERKRLQERARGAVVSTLQNASDVDRARAWLRPGLAEDASRYFAGRARLCAAHARATTWAWPFRILTFPALMGRGAAALGLTRGDRARVLLPDWAFDALTRWRAR